MGAVSCRGKFRGNDITAEILRLLVLRQLVGLMSGLFREILCTLLAGTLSTTVRFRRDIGPERVARLGQSAPGDQRRYFRAPPLFLW